MKDEKDVLSFWEENKIFEKTLEKPAPAGNFVFYDGPPFATGTPHYGHILPGTMKDVIPRYQTMKGKRVRRVWGWDCHGLPIESLVQKELGVSTKKDIENFGIERFNEAARASVFRYDSLWKEVIPKTGRWIDMENQYTTMDQGFTESVWWGFKKIYDKGLVYEDFKSMHVSPLLETPLSNFEVNQNYKDIEDISVYAKFELQDEIGTFVLAWTTTPWTLPGNAALAVGSDISYVKSKKDGEQYIVAKDLMEKVLKEDYEIVDTFKGEKLVGRSYKPVFDYYFNQQDLEDRENGWKIYSADFVTVEDGTGIVHVAPAFGEDDLNLGKKEKLPFIQHVNIDGTIKREVSEFAGRQAKPKATPDEPKKHQETDIEVLKNLAHKGLLFAKEKYMHSYPHCWRTDAPLLNYAMSSWFIKVTDIKDKIVRENKKVNWVPEDIRDGRFGKWLEGARDWAISRNRYWGAPIPIWKSEDGKDVEVIGSIEDIKERCPGRIRDIYVMRHGESKKNVLGVFDRELDKYPLTDTGRTEVLKSVSKLKGKLDTIITSPVRRTKETAEIVAKELGVEVVISEELREVDQGSWEGKKENEVNRKAYDSLPEEQYYRAPRGDHGESWKDVEDRVYSFVKNTLEETNKNVLFITHGGLMVYLTKSLRRLSLGKTRDLFKKDEYKGYANAIHFYIDTGTMKEFDFHRPYIDDITWKNKRGKEMKRIPDVFDTWIDSGSMPFAQVHYPFENKERFEKKDSPLFPADFLAESLDQTRGWFYTLLVLNTALFDKSPYKNVAVGGLILAEDGRKMSKSLKNYPEMDYVLNKYGGDALRYYLMASPAVRGEEMLFSEKGVDEVVKKVVIRLKNVHSFYKLYKTGNIRNDSSYVLDKWLIERFKVLRNEVTKYLDSFELDKASRPFADFVDDLSTWYVRRSRDRFKEGKIESIETLGYILKELTKILAPIMPFVSEEIYQDLKTDADPESVHLESWPEEKVSFWKDIFAKKKNILDDMIKVRDVISEALEKRASAGIKVRQPLQSLTVKGDIKEEYIELIKDEVNVKEVILGGELSLDTNITDELEKEGMTRDIIRFVQDLRKKAGLSPDDLIVSFFDKEVPGVEEIKKQVNAVEVKIDQEREGQILKTSKGEIKISIDKV
ncbi:MAG: class I tRNA ligase family protein [Candidatus Pacebacteria bacterium]|nr:class I tRNA ligase family protein [Candidatus Paceibacterota bacterium]